MDTDIKAVQLAASGQITTKRSYFRKVFITHTGGGDAELKFYDLDAAPVGAEPYYSFYVHGKQIHQVDMPDPGVLFNNGVYVVLPADCKCTVLYNEA
jgi:hypothetical protein